MELELLHAEFVQETVPLAHEVEAKLLAIEDALRIGADASVSWHELLGVLHHVKGNCGVVHFTAAQTLTHVMEERAKNARGGDAAAQSQAVQALLQAADALRENIASPERQSPALEEAARALAVDGGARSPLPVAPAPRSPSVRSPVTYASYAVDRAADVRISAEKLDRLLELVGELSIHHGRVAEMTRSLADRVSSWDEEAAACVDMVDQLGKTIGSFRSAVTEARLLPLSGALARFPRLVRDLCITTGKRARLEMTGAETVVDKTIVDAIGEPLLHLVRNAVDHGIEAPKAREASGKSAEGRIVLHVGHRAGELVFTLEDDGGGIPRAKLREKARARGIATDGWADEDVVELIFLPEMSTAETVTELSGRGVGLDAARRAVERIGGSMTVASDEGRGTRFLIRVPLTLTIQRVLLVECHAEIYAIGLTSVVATLRVALEELHTIDGRAFLRFRGRLLPVVDLTTWLAVPDGGAHLTSVLCVVVEDGARTCGLLVTGVLGQQDVVLKELDPALGKPAGLSGATVLANGRVAMVLDARAIAGAQRSGATQRARLLERGRFV